MREIPSDVSQRHLLDLLTSHVSDDEVALVNQAYSLAESAHAGQVRDEGAPYIVHPLRVAISLVDELSIYSPTLVTSALLHDVIEDSSITREQIGDMFGDEVARIVWLLTKLEDVSLGAYLAAIEAASETGAPLVKLCDRLDNLRGLSRSPKADKKRRYIFTTEQFYLPLARRTNSYLYDEMCHWLDRAREHVESLK
ncbi:MAG TPA: HD domain-containing protein [Blastocatellia bacterium]|nr:HD domain-containing protein [Blastocatellia bacterium]